VLVALHAMRQVVGLRKRKKKRRKKGDKQWVSASMKKGTLNLNEIEVALMTTEQTASW
jgi:hypothetical protein